MLYCPNFFWNVLQVWMTGKDVYLQMTWSWPDKTWNILCSYCLQWNTSQSQFRNHYFLFLFAFSILSQLFLIWGCIKRETSCPGTCAVPFLCHPTCVGAHDFSHRPPLTGSTWSHRIPCNDHGPLTPNLWWHHGIAENSVMGSQKWYQCKCHQRDTGNFIVIIKWYIGYQHCHYCIYVGVWFFNVNSHNSFIYITLHMYEHVTQPLLLNLPFLLTYHYITDRHNYRHNLFKKVLMFQVFRGKMIDLWEE